MLKPEYFAKLEILDRWEEQLGDMTAASAWNEGYNSLEEFKVVWERIFERPWDEEEWVKAVRFQVVEVSLDWIEQHPENAIFGYQVKERRRYQCTINNVMERIAESAKSQS